jgi:hypothetical protein
MACDPTRRTFHQQVVQQMTVVSALFGGFSFTNLCLMPQEPEASFFSQLNVALAGVATCLLVGSAFLGGIFALLANALDMEEMLERERAIFAPWGAMVSVGIVTFFVNLAMIAMRTAPWVGALVALAALCVVFFTLYACGRLLDLGARPRAPLLSAPEPGGTSA